MPTPCHLASLLASYIIYVNALNPNHKELLTVAMGAAETLPVERRCRLYRGMAEICGDPGEAKRLVALAVQFENTQNLCREFKFSFEQQTSVSGGGR